MLTEEEVVGFGRDGFVVVRGAVGRSVMGACVDVVWGELEGQGFRRDDVFAQPGVALLEPLPLVDRSTAYPVEAAVLDAIGTR
ncbi:hypothetical protein F1D05_35455 [Kribbella qitaiheensis]|uniref:Uncharacterized protein n=1 Tax=Kribbella qitaiheensis TaxID=1544730 RepID=A0A7G6X7M1_9ACTN|nr:hypothetical protein [Kribbella qitaiheensis]QNE22236.1 hypothetical protein F1D05_35455 [Kribbella qitaiheensis]